MAIDPQPVVHNRGVQPVVHRFRVPVPPALPVASASQAPVPAADKKEWTISATRREPIRQVRLSDSSVRYEVTVDVGRDAAGKRRQSRTRYRTLREAKVALAQTRVALNDGTHVARAVLSVRTYLEQWVEGKIDLRSSTREGYSFALKPVLARYGDLPLQQLTKTHLDRMVTDQLATGGITGTGRSARTVTLTLVVLGQALDAAVRQRLVTVNVAGLVNRPAPQAVVVKKTWTAEQVRDSREAT